METLVQLAPYGVPVVALVVFGLVWLSRSAVKEVSLVDAPKAGDEVARTALAAERLEFQLAIAEDLEAGPDTLNSLQHQCEVARSNADHVRTRAEQEAATQPVTVPWYAPVTALWSGKNNPEDGSGQKR